MFGTVTCDLRHQQSVVGASDKADEKFPDKNVRNFDGFGFGVCFRLEVVVHVEELVRGTVILEQASWEVKIIHDYVWMSLAFLCKRKLLKIIKIESQNIAGHGG